MGTTSFVKTSISLTSVVITWNAPATNGGSPVTGYKVEI